MNNIETMKLALEALETLNSGDTYKTHNAATALRQAIEQAQVATNDTSQERVDETEKQRHWVEIDGDDWIKALEMADFDTVAAFEFFANKIKELNT